MANKASWEENITLSNLGSAPTILGDSNVVEATENAKDVLLSATFNGGTNPEAVVAIYFYNAASSTFELTGDTITIDPDVDNLHITNPRGLILGFTATVVGSPSDMTLHVGVHS